MYCKYCGKQNSDSDFYCIHCGSAMSLQKNMLKVSGMREERISFCKKCGERSDSRFCVNCGEPTYKLAVEQGADVSFGVNNLKSIKNIAETTIKDQYKSIKAGDMSGVKNLVNNKDLLKNSAITAAKIFVICLVLSFALFMVFKQIDKVSEVYDQVSRLKSEEGITKVNILPNTLDVYGAALQIPSTFKASGSLLGQDLGKTKIGLNIHILILLLIPFAAVWISLFKVFKDSKSTLQHISEYIMSSVIFSIVTNIILLFNAKSLIGDESGINIRISGHFNFLAGSITAFLIIFCMQLLMSVIYKKESIANISANGFYSENLKAVGVYIKNMAMYSLYYMAIIVLGILFADGGAKQKLIAIFAFIAALPNMLANTWLFIFGNKLSVILTDSAQMQLYLMDAWKAISTMTKLSGGKTISLLPFAILLILIVFAVIYILIESARKLSKDKYFVKLASFAGSVAVINLLLALLCNFGIKLSGSTVILQQLRLPYLDGSVSVFSGFPAFRVIIFSFIFVYAMGAIAYLSKSVSSVSKVFEFVEEKGTIIKIGYLVITLIFMFLARESALNYFKQLQYLLQNSFNIF